jgi:hypothetical protein
MVGNYGVPCRKKLDKYGLPAMFESHKIWASGLICQDYSHHYSHWKAASSLGDWLKEEAYQENSRKGRHGGKDRSGYDQGGSRFQYHR